MSTNESVSSKWAHPDEFMKLQRLKQRKKQLAARIQNNNNSSKCTEILGYDKNKLLEAKIAQKRKNPFAKSIDTAKKQRTDKNLHIEEDSLLDFINSPPVTSVSVPESFVRETPTRTPPAKLVLQPFDPKVFSKLLQQSSANAATESDDVEPEQLQRTKHLPMDWCLKSRARIFCEKDLPSTALKTLQLASGLTSFVRCIDTTNCETSLDISEAARFNQATYYWQHPHLPWLTLFPRNSKDNIGVTIGERERKALADEWGYSFRGLFQLLRAKQCPYFYLCANTFTVLFRAAGIGGCVETHALMTPSTRGMRNALRQEGIEFSMPLKKEATSLNKSSDGSFTTQTAGHNQSDSKSNIGVTDTKSPLRKEVKKDDEGEDEAEDDDDEDWLESLGVDEKEIRKIQTAHARKLKVAEMSEDFSDNSLLLIEGVECQGFFSYLLNAKSTITSVGRLAGVPPTLLAPVAFPKATMQHLTARSNKVRLDGIVYHSIDVKGLVLPTFLPYICQLLGETKQMYSVTLGSHTNTLAFSKATRKLLEARKNDTAVGEHDINNETDDTAAGQVFGQENLSECGLLHGVIESLCRTGQNAVSLLERVCYNHEEGYAWS